MCRTDGCFATDDGLGSRGLRRPADLIWLSPYLGDRMLRIVFNLVILLIQAFLLARAVVVFFEAGWVAGLAFVLLVAAFSLAKFRAPAQQS